MLFSIESVCGSTDLYYFLGNSFTYSGVHLDIILKIMITNHEREHKPHT